MEETVELAAGDWRVALLPARGGSLARCAWRGQAVMRPVCGPSVLDTACYPLAPFSNRIAFGRFVAHGREVRLSPNHPGMAHPHPLHGFAWLRRWQVVEQSHARIRLGVTIEPREWPWRHRVEQELAVEGNALRHAVSLRNDGDSAMPAGLGLHPFFPLTATTTYLGLHHYQADTAPDGLPCAMRDARRPVDWWQGAPASTRAVDTCYVGRVGPLLIGWPDRGLYLSIAPDAVLDNTVVYIPAGADFFCVEPVSHATDAINRVGGGGMRWLRPGETMAAAVTYTVSAMNVGS